MRIDIHMHTTRYSGCAHSTPEEMMVAAIAGGLDAVVITEHHQTWSVDETRELNRQFPQLRIFRGMEYTTNNDGNDILVIGADHPERFYRGMRGDDIVRETHAQGGVAVLAHPFRLRSMIPAELLNAPPDCYEVASFNMLIYARRQAVTLETLFPEAHGVMASDGHNTVALGGYAIDIPSEVRDEHELADVLKSGQFRLSIDHNLVKQRYARWQQLQHDRIQVYLDQGASFGEIVRRSHLGPPIVDFIMNGGDLCDR